MDSKDKKSRESIMAWIGLAHSSLGAWPSTTPKFSKAKNQRIITGKGKQEGFFRTAQGRPASQLADQVT